MADEQRYKAIAVDVDKAPVTWLPQRLNREWAAGWRCVSWNPVGDELICLLERRDDLPATSAE